MEKKRAGGVCVCVWGGYSDLSKLELMYLCVFVFNSMSV